MSLEKAKTYFDYISIIIALVATIVYLIGLFTYMEMASVMVYTLLPALIGIGLGIIAFIIALMKKLNKRMSLVGILLNVLFIFFAVVVLFTSMGGP